MFALVVLLELLRSISSLCVTLNDFLCCVRHNAFFERLSEEMGLVWQYKRRNPVTCSVTMKGNAKSGITRSSLFIPSFASTGTLSLFHVHNDCSAVCRGVFRWHVLGIVGYLYIIFCMGLYIEIVLKFCTGYIRKDVMEVDIHMMTSYSDGSTSGTASSWLCEWLFRQKPLRINKRSSIMRLSCTPELNIYWTILRRSYITLTSANKTTLTRNWSLVRYIRGQRTKAWLTHARFWSPTFTCSTTFHTTSSRISSSHWHWIYFYHINIAA